MTDEQIIKGLRLCANNNGSCRECPLYSMHSANCIIKLMNITLDLIKRQQAEIERKKKILDSYALQYGTVTDQSKKIKEIKDEAYKEFAEKIKESKYQSSDWSHGEHPFVVEEDDIDDVLWKMTEGSNEV